MPIYKAFRGVGFVYGYDVWISLEPIFNTVPADICLLIFHYSPNIYRLFGFLNVIRWIMHIKLNFLKYQIFKLKKKLFRLFYFEKYTYYINKLTDLLRLDRSQNLQDWKQRFWDWRICFVIKVSHEQNQNWRKGLMKVYKRS